MGPFTRDGQSQHILRQSSRFFVVFIVQGSLQFMYVRQCHTRHVQMTHLYQQLADTHGNLSSGLVQVIARCRHECISLKRTDIM